MGWLSEDRKRLLERWTLLIGGVEMLIGASMAAFPAVFPPELAVAAMAIALLTIGVGLTLVWTDISKIAAVLRLQPSWIGPIVSVTGLAIILALGFWYWHQAPKGTFSGSPAGTVLVASILVVGFFFLMSGGHRTAVQAKPAEPTTPPAPAASITAPNNGAVAKLGNQVRNLDRSVFLLLARMTDQLDIELLEAALAKAPHVSPSLDLAKITATELIQETEKFREYLQLVDRRLDLAVWRRDLEVLWSQVDCAADDNLRDVKIPNDLNFVDVRKNWIARNKCEAAEIVIRRQLVAIEDRQRTNRQMLERQKQLHEN